MNSPELAPTSPEDFGMEFDFGLDDFDINAAFQEALYGVATDAELELGEKVRRMEVIVSEGTSDLYREFVDFQAMASQIQIACNHDHGLRSSIMGSELFHGIIANPLEEANQIHEHTHPHHEGEDDDEEEDD